MNISVERYELTVTERELWDIVYGYRSRYIEQSVDHCALMDEGDGMRVLEYNYTDQLESMRFMCSRLGRIDVYDDAISQFKKSVKEKKEQIEANRAAQETTA